MAEDKETAALIADVKNYLDITWKDTFGEEKLKGIVKRGMDTLANVIGKCNFFEETQERALLFDYVMYCRAGELFQFWENHRTEIISMQISRKVDDYADTEV